MPLLELSDCPDSFPTQESHSEIEKFQWLILILRRNDSTWFKCCYSQSHDQLLFTPLLYSSPPLFILVHSLAPSPSLLFISLLCCCFFFVFTLTWQANQVIRVCLSSQSASEKHNQEKKRPRIIADLANFSKTKKVCTPCLIIIQSKRVLAKTSDREELIAKKKIYSSRTIGHDFPLRTFPFFDKRIGKSDHREGFHYQSDWRMV